MSIRSLVSVVLCWMCIVLGGCSAMPAFQENAPLSIPSQSPVPTREIATIPPPPYSPVEEYGVSGDIIIMPGDNGSHVINMVHEMERFSDSAYDIAGCIYSTIENSGMDGIALRVYEDKHFCVASVGARGRDTGVTSQDIGIGSTVRDVWDAYYTKEIEDDGYGLACIRYPMLNGLLTIYLSGHSEDDIVQEWYITRDDQQNPRDIINSTVPPMC